MNRLFNQPAAATRQAPRTTTPPAGKDTRQLLKAGGWLLAAGAICLVLIKTVFGGISQHGVHTNSAWLLLVGALGCLPLGIFLCLLGGAKWLGKRGR